MIISGFHLQLRKAVKGSEESLVALGKVETNQMMDILTEKTTARDGPHPNMLSQPLAKMQVVFHTIS